MTRPLGVAPPRKRRSRAPLAHGERPRRQKNFPPSEELLTVLQVAENWQISQRTIRRMIADGKLSVVRLGRAVRIPAKVFPLNGTLS